MARGQSYRAADAVAKRARQQRMANKSPPPILAGKEYAAASVFEPANLLREARRQKGLPQAEMPEICLLDPDGDIVRALRRALAPSWACYHTELSSKWHALRHHRLAAPRCGAAAGAVCFRLPLPDQRDVGRPDRAALEPRITGRRPISS